MSRFSGLPSPRATAGTGARFASLPEELASMRQPARIDQIRAVWADHCSESSIDSAHHRDEMARLASTKPVAAKPMPSAPARASSAPKKAAASVSPKPTEITIPADITAQGPEAVSAYRTGFARNHARLAELSKHPAVAGRSAEAIMLFKRGMSNADIIAHLTKEQRARAADAVWDRARASIAGNPATTPAADDKAGKSGAHTKSDAVWDRARAAVDRGSQVTATAAKPEGAAPASVWDRAYAKLDQKYGAAR